MREEDSNWFSKWEDELPSPDELTPLSQTLISRDLAMAFDIQPSSNFSGGGHQFPMNRRAPPPLGPTHHPISGDFDSSGGSEEPARTLKRPRLVWTPQLHKRFVDAVAHLGIKNAVPKTIMQLMSVDGLTRENVASHLQKYRLYLKRMQGINNGGVAGGGGSAGGGSGDPATDHLFASSPVPAHFLHPQGSGGGGGYVSPVTSLHHPHQVAAMVVGGTYHHHHNHHRQMGHFQNSFLSRQAQMGGARLGVTVSSGGIGGGVGGGEDLDSGASGRKVLTLFPSIDD